MGSSPKGSGGWALGGNEHFLSREVSVIFGLAILTQLRCGKSGLHNLDHLKSIDGSPPPKWSIHVNACVPKKHTYSTVLLGVLFTSTRSILHVALFNSDILIDCLLDAQLETLALISLPLSR